MLTVAYPVPAIITALLELWSGEGLWSSRVVGGYSATLCSSLSPQQWMIGWTVSVAMSSFLFIVPLQACHSNWQQRECLQSFCCHWEED